MTFGILPITAFGTFADDKTFAVRKSFLRVHARIHGDEDVPPWDAIV